MSDLQKNTIDNPGYTKSLTTYHRRASLVVPVGNLPLGGDYPIRIQSMTTIDTMDTEGSVAQVLKMVEAGCEYVRITAPSIKEAQNLKEIQKKLRAAQCFVPLIADIHFTPNAAELAARIVEKVRINPGNYADKKKFEVVEYSDASYAFEVDKLRSKFIPLIKICKEYGTAMRIGTNHGSLSDRILSRYGDTPLGMVESALEFLRICEELNYYQIVLSMKASNTQVMVQAYRLLVAKLQEEKLKPYPLHLGVTEAGDGEDGRIKSALGIGALLEDGLGDTVRVSLTEPPECEAPVARMLVSRYATRHLHKPIKEVTSNPINPYQYQRRHTTEVVNFGKTNVPRVIANYSKIEVKEYSDLKPIGYHYLPVLDKWSMTDLGSDYIYTGSKSIPFMLPNGLRQLVDYSAWVCHPDQINAYPLFQIEEYLQAPSKHPMLNVVAATYKCMTDEFLSAIKHKADVVLMFTTHNAHTMAAFRRLFFFLFENDVTVPVIINSQYASMDSTTLQLHAATDCGGLFIDGLGDGIMLSGSFDSDNDSVTSGHTLKFLNKLSFGILQAARTRMSKTEYISCPSCGRTLFDLQETTAMIRKRTDHLKGVKIGIMGCIVNGPGEMADADYGYVGVGKDKIALYRGQTIVKKAVPAIQAVDELIELIKEDGNWIEPVKVELEEV